MNGGKSPAFSLIRIKRLLKASLPPNLFAKHEELDENLAKFLAPPRDKSPPERGQPVPRRLQAAQRHAWKSAVSSLAARARLRRSGTHYPSIDGRVILLV